MCTLLLFAGTFFHYSFPPAPSEGVCWYQASISSSSVANGESAGWPRWSWNVQPPLSFYVQLLNKPEFCSFLTWRAHCCGWNSHWHIRYMWRGCKAPQNSVSIKHIYTWIRIKWAGKCKIKCINFLEAMSFKLIDTIQNKYFNHFI